MNKQELAIVMVLFAVLIGWGFWSRPTPTEGLPQGLPPPADAPVVAPGDASLPPPDEAADPVLATPRPEAPAGVTAPVTAPTAPDAVPHWPSGRRVMLSNDWSRVEVDTHGGVLRSVELPGYRASVDADSAPVHLDFEDVPALLPSGLPGFESVSEFEVLALTTTSILIRATSPAGLQFERALELRDRYQIAVQDRFVNLGDTLLVLPAPGLGLGPMRMGAGETRMAGMVYMGLDSLAAQGGSRVEHWGKKLDGLFGVRSGFLASCARPNLTGVPAAVDHEEIGPTDWVAAKNKYFVQILEPRDPAEGFRIKVGRDAEASALIVESVGAEMAFAALRLEPGESAERVVRYYAGPKKYDILKTFGKYQHDIMQFGWWDWFRWLCKALLWALNGFYSLIPNYGIAIILVTVTVRLIFWPITQKSTDSMKKMQKVQPLVAAIRERNKDNPQKMNQEIMTLYREHKVNPLSGCLPMLVQIPVFIALFVVLRSAIELRFAGFLWIRDLSEPERLLAGVLPIPLNILPLLMTATTVLQQKMTPTAGDPQQQKIMMMMPVLFLFLFYNMASALVLYWTVSQALAILQLKLQKPAPDLVPAPVAPAPRPAIGPGPGSGKKNRRRK